MPCVTQLTACCCHSVVATTLHHTPREELHFIVILRSTYSTYLEVPEERMGDLHWVDEGAVDQELREGREVVVLELETLK